MRQYADSTLKKWTKEELIQAIRCLEENNDGLHEMNDRQFKLLMQKEKYRWHDLRKNPEDLPEDNDGTYTNVYEAVDESGEHFICAYFGTADGQYSEGVWEYDAYCEGKIIAWREIEPFEGVEE